MKYLAILYGIAEYLIRLALGQPDPQAFESACGHGLVVIVLAAAIHAWRRDREFSRRWRAWRRATG